MADNLLSVGWCVQCKNHWLVAHMKKDKQKYMVVGEADINTANIATKTTIITQNHIDPQLIDT